MSYDPLRFLEGVGSPVGAVTPMFIGQLYHDSNADSYYRSTGMTSADWTAVGGGGGSNKEGEGAPT